jgi:hypothetical protein
MVDIALQQRERDSLIVAEIPFSKAVDADEARQRMADLDKADNSTDDA